MYVCNIIYMARLVTAQSCLLSVHGNRNWIDPSGSSFHI
jgi:hypothetical protein